MNKNHLIQVNCPHCNLLQEVLIEKGNQIANCDGEIQGCETDFAVEIKSAFVRKEGENSFRQFAIARKIEGITPSQPEESEPLLVFYDFVVIQPFCDSDDYPATFQMIEKHELENEQRKVSEATGDNCGVRVVAKFQAIVERKPKGGKAFNFINPNIIK